MAVGKTVDRFVSRIVNNLDDDCVLLVLLPWTRLPAPPGVLIPMRHPQEGLKYSEEELEQLRVKNPRTLLIPCTFDADSEEDSASRLLPQLLSKTSPEDDVCVFMVYLYQNELESNGEDAIDLVLDRHNRMLQLHPDDVIVNPPHDLAALRQTIRLARLSWSMNVRRIQMFMAEEPEPVEPQVLSQLHAHHRRLFWESIPRVLLRNFATIDRNVEETSRRVGTYRFFKPLRTVQGTVLQAINKEDQQRQLFAVKVMDKSRVLHFTQLAGIYREYGFLSHNLEHPNIVRCVQMIHAPSRLYFVFEYAGDQNLVQVLESRPDNRVEGIERRIYFRQIIAALLYCHGRGISHRLVSLDHVVVMEIPGNERYRCRLVDFQSSVESHDGDTRSVTVCGTLPSAAPEVLMGGPYLPEFADCWSAGTVFIEMAGGLSLIRRCVDYEEDHTLDSALQVQNFFRAPGSHSRILRFSYDGEQDPSTLQLVQMLVQPIAEERAQMREVAQLEFLQTPAT